MKGRKQERGDEPRAASRRPGAKRGSGDTPARNHQWPRAKGGKRKRHSGRLMLRISPSLHAELARVAEQEGMSLNQYILNALSTAMGRAATEREQRGPPWLPKALRAAIVVTVAAAILAIVLLVLVWAHGR